MAVKKFYENLDNRKIVCKTEIEFERIDVSVKDDVKIIFGKKGYPNTILHLSTRGAKDLADLLLEAARIYEKGENLK